MGTQKIVQNTSFSELLAIYALDALADEEQIAVEDVLDRFPELQQELAEWQLAVSAIPYSAPLVPLADDLKDRLMARIDRTATIAELEAQAQTVDWEPYLSKPGTVLGKLWVDSDRREIQCFVRSLGATQFPRHRHAGEEEIIVLDGDLTIDGKRYQKGDRIYSSSGSAHQPETRNGCFLYLRTSLDDEVLDRDNLP
jgi:ChrR Cupin-like domain